MSKNIRFYIPKNIEARLCDKGIEKNGCGSGWNAALVPDNWFGIDFTIPCAIHDEMYAVGKTVEDKNEADRIFLNNMLRVADAESCIFRSFGRFLARRYYNMVVTYGGPAYWADKNEPGRTIEAYTDVGVGALKAVVRLKGVKL